MKLDSHYRGNRRTLISIPIIHTSSDMGRLGESVRHATIERMGRQGWKRNLNRIEKMWTEIERAIDMLDLCYDKVRLYQDGLPICDKEVEIVEELAATGSRNHRLLIRLQERGARIMGTESPELLVEEYQLVKQLLGARSAREAARIQARQKALSSLLLERRDRFIADRINRTLCPGETGVLFLGMLHSPQKWLDKDIRVVCPVTHPAASERSTT